MIKVKQFLGIESILTPDVEGRINEWLSKNENIEVVDIKLSSDSIKIGKLVERSMYALIIYKEER